MPATTTPATRTPASHDTMDKQTVRYQGFVHVPDPLDGVQPGQAQVMAAAALMDKSARHATQALHSLFARGIKKMLVLETHPDRITARFKGNGQALVLEIPLKRVAAVGCIRTELYIVCRRPATMHFNCHMFELKHAAGAAALALKLSYLHQPLYTNDQVLQMQAEMVEMKELHQRTAAQLNALRSNPGLNYEELIDGHPNTNCAADTTFASHHFPFSPPDGTATPPAPSPYGAQRVQVSRRRPRHADVSRLSLRRKVDVQQFLDLSQHAQSASEDEESGSERYIDITVPDSTDVREADDDDVQIMFGMFGFDESGPALTLSMLDSPCQTPASSPRPSRSSSPTARRRSSLVSVAATGPEDQFEEDADARPRAATTTDEDADTRPRAATNASMRRFEEDADARPRAATTTDEDADARPRAATNASMRRFEEGACEFHRFKFLPPGYI